MRRRLRSLRRCSGSGWCSSRFHPHTELIFSLQWSNTERRRRSDRSDTRRWNRWSGRGCSARPVGSAPTAGACPNLWDALRRRSNRVALPDCASRGLQLFCSFWRTLVVSGAMRSTTWWRAAGLRRPPTCLSTRCCWPSATCCSTPTATSRSPVRSLTQCSEWSTCSM